MTETVECWHCGQHVGLTRDFCDCLFEGSPPPLRFGKYRVLNRLGSGAFGTVFRCFDPDLKRTVAIKKLDRVARSVAGDLLELQAPSRLNHPNIVTIFDVLPDLGAIVMEYVQGGTLHSRLRDDRNWVLSNFSRLMLEVCAALRAAHSEGIIHRDIKPENILIAVDGSAKVADFGVCKLLSTAEYTEGVAGSPPYMAKEVLAGEPYSYEADIHSLGCVMYEIWAGRLPYVAHGGLGAYLAVKSQGDPQSLMVAASSPVDDLLNDLVGRMLTTGPRRVKNIDTVVQQLTLRIPQSPTGTRSIDEMQVWIGGIYGYANSGKSPTYLLDQYLVSINSIGQELLRRPEQSAELDRLFPKAFAWLCAAATSVNMRLGQLTWLKYDKVCPYCSELVCVCAVVGGTDRSARNAQLLERAKDRMMSQASEPQTMHEYQVMFRRIYGNANANDGLLGIAYHALTEVAEALDAVLHLSPKSDWLSVRAMQLEFSDLVAWYFALLNAYRDDYDVVTELETLFQAGCYACSSKQCQCPEPLGIANWRLALKVVPHYEAE